MSFDGRGITPLLPGSYNNLSASASMANFLNPPAASTGDALVPTRTMSHLSFSSTNAGGASTTAAGATPFARSNQSDDSLASLPTPSGGRSSSSPPPPGPPTTTLLHRSSTSLYTVTPTPRVTYITQHALPTLAPTIYTLSPQTTTCLTEYRTTHLAMSDKSGRLTLLPLTPTVEGLSNLAQYTPKHPRPANAISATSRYVAIALQGYRRDFCVHVYSPPSATPVLKYANSEPTYGVMFTGESGLVTGHEGVVRCYDTRSPSQPTSVVCHEGTRVGGMEWWGTLMCTTGRSASGGRQGSGGMEMCCVWDVRKLESPVCSVKCAKNEEIVSGVFSEDGRSVCVLSRELGADVSVIRNYGVGGGGVVNGEDENTRPVVNFRPSMASSLYLNGRVTRFVTVNNTHACILRQDGSVVVNKMNERRAVGVSRKHGVAVDWGDNVRFCELPKDVETLMRARAVSGYGVKKHASVEDDNILSVWEFVDRGEYENTFVDTMFTDELKQDQIITIYEDENRRTLARTCGWAQQPASPDDCIPGTLESTKAGVRRVFFLDDFEAICEILDDSTESKLVRMCVTGYKPESANWMKAARDLIITVRSNPYLVMLLETMLGVAQSDSTPAKARFPFLFDDSIAIADRVGVAAKFLPAALLSSYIKDLYKSCLVSGDISGLVLTGLGTSHGMDLLQRYVDCSGDVQTAALVTAGLTKPERVHEWLESYRDLLNGWGLWTVRAKLDIERGEILRRRGVGSTAKGKGGKVPLTVAEELVKVPKQLFTRCNYCNLSLPLNVLRRQEGTADSWLMRQKPVLSACPGCTKPLPKCYVCLLNLGALNPYLEKKRMREVVVQKKGEEGESGLEELASLPFQEWWSFCVSCHHGGHASHILSWFDKHDTCGVSECDCQCKRHVSGA